MRTMHQLAVPEEAKQEDETKRCDECDEEFFPVHNLFRLRLLLSPKCPGIFIAKWRIVVDSKFLSPSRSRTNDEARMTKHRIRSSDFVIPSSLDIRHSIRSNVQAQLA